MQRAFTASWTAFRNRKRDPGCTVSTAWISLKSYGDLVIAARCLRHLLQRPDTSHLLYAGSHLRELGIALGLQDAILWIDSASDRDVPAAFDVRRKGVFAAVRSLHALRRRLSALPASQELVFDRLGWRERIIAGDHRARALPVSGNIYSAYAALLRTTAADAAIEPLSAVHPGGRAVIVPVSRLSHKMVPVADVARTHDTMSKAGLVPEILLLEGEPFQVPTGIPVRVIPRQFSALAQALQRATLVVSADSLAAHLAEYLQRPAFVLTPAPNTYWLPPAAFADAGWACFGDGTPLHAWLEATVSKASR